MRQYYNLEFLGACGDSIQTVIMTTFVSANDLNFRLITPLNVAAKRMGIDWNFNVGTTFPVRAMARSEREG